MAVMASVQFFRGRALEGDFEFRSGRGYLGGKALPRWQILWSRKLNQAVLDGLPKSPPVHARNDLTIAIPSGYRIGFESIFSLGQGAGHLLVIGPTGAGKSELLHLALASLDGSVDLLIADFKGGALITENLRDARVVTDLDSDSSQVTFWNDLAETMKLRQQVLLAAGVASWEQLERIGGGQGRALVVVDEAVSALRNSTRASEVLCALAAKGRSLGVHLLITSQSLIGIPRELLVNMRSRLAIEGTDQVELLQLGCKESISRSQANERAAVLINDGSVQKLAFPLGIRQAPQIAP